VEDEIVPFEIDQDIFFRNSAKTKRRGLEAGITTEVYEGLKATVSYTYSDFVYDEYSALTLDDLFVPSYRDFSGNIVPSVPKHNLFTSLEYRKRVISNIYGFVKGSYQNISGMYVDDANSDETDGYQLLNTSLGFELLAGNFSVLVSGGVNNLLDKLYVAFININAARGRYYEVGEPQSIFGVVKLGYYF
jgi:iron complex outermembrane receptor protein